MRRLGAIHRPAPAAVPLLAARARLDLHTPKPLTDWLKTLPANGDELLNDKLGDCVPVSALWMAYLWRANAWGDSRRPVDAQAEALYTAWGGYNPATGVPDDGCDTALAMTLWATKGIQTDPQTESVPTWTKIDPTRLVDVRVAIDLLGPVRFTLNLPAAAQDLAAWRGQPGTGPDWAPGSWGAHSVAAGRQDATSFSVRTWGTDLIISHAFFFAYCVAVDGMLDREWLATTGLSPSGLDWTALHGDMASL